MFLLGIFMVANSNLTGKYKTVEKRKFSLKKTDLKTRKFTSKPDIKIQNV